MKKLTLFLVAMLFSTLSFAALNPFAYGLSSNPNADQTELTINYSLNATATNVDFVLLDGDKVIKTVNLNDKGLDKGSYTATVALDDPNMPLGKKLSWRIDVKGNSVAQPTQESTNYGLYCPHGLAIDNNPESENFGRILVSESMHEVASKSATTYISGGKGAGLYVFNPDFTTDKTRYTGGNDFTRKLTSNGYQPYQVKISEDGRIFVSSCDINGVVVWEVSKDLNTWTPVISGTNDATDYTIKKDGAFFAGLNVAMDVKGSGDDLTLLLYSTNNKGIAYNQSGYRLDEYKLGKATTFTGTPKKILEGGKFGVTHTDVDFIYDGEGGYWFGGSRGGNAGQPNLVHIKADGTEDYRDETTTFYGGGGVLVHKGLLFKGLARTSSTVGNFGIYTIGKDANGKTTLTQKWKVASTGLGRNHNEFAVDFAENLYVIGNNGEKILAYALPYSGSVSTPCASKYAFTINSTAQMAKASELNPYAYNLSSTFNSATKKLTVNYTLNANATAVDIVIMDVNMEMKRVSCSGITRGSYTETISCEDLHMNRELKWKVEVKGTSKPVPTQVSTYYSLYCPHGLAIDKDPTSDNFGRIIAVEGMQAVPATGYLSSGQGAGLYVFNPDFSTDGKVRNGGLDFTRQWASYGYQPWRVKISEDGRIFVSSCDLNGKFVWELSKDLNTWTEVLARGQEKTSSTMKGNAFTTSDGQFLAGMNLSMDVQGSGKDLKLLLYSASGTGITGQTQSLFRLDEYELGEATKWDNANQPTSITCFNGKYGFMYNNVNIIYDGEGGYWFGASRAGNTNQPNLVHFDKNGNRDYYSESSEFYGGDGILLHNGMLIKGKARTDANTGNFGVYTISKDASGNLVLTEKWSVKANHIGRNLNEFAVDYGENLYVVGNSGEKIIAFAMPYSGMISTPCQKEYNFTIYPGYEPTKTDQLNPFAYNLSSELDSEWNLKVNYSLNSKANSAQVVIMNGNTPVKTVNCTGLTKGSHTITISTEGLPAETDLTWKMVVNGTSVTKVEEYNTNYDVYHPSAIDIDNNPENETFGLILTTEALNEVKGKTSKNYLGKDFGAGIFAFDAAFNYTGKYNGGITFTDKRTDSTDKAYAPRRVRISDDGRIFVTSLNTNGDVLWEVNPKDMNQWTPIFQGLTQDANKDLVNGSTFVAGPNAGFDVRGSGENLQLLMLSANTQTFGFGQRGFRISEYNLGTKTSWNTAPSKAFPHENLSTGQCYFIAPTSSQVQYDKDGGVWYISNRNEATNSQPGLVYFDKNGNEKYKGLYSIIENGAFRFNKDFTKVAIASNTALNIYTVTKDAAGVPVLTHELGLKLTTVGRNSNDFAWDYADNLYAIGYTKEKFVAYRMPYNGQAITPAAEKYTFQVPAQPVEIVGVVKRAIQIGESTVVLTHENDGTPHIYNVTDDNVAAISLDGVVACDTDNAGDLLSISDIAVTDDGKLIACNKIVCQSDNSQVAAGYKRGEIKFYIWNNLADNPTIWFTSKQSSNWYKSIQGHTMAYKGTSTNGTLFTTGVTATGIKFRYSVYNVINGVYTEPTTNNSEYYHFTKGDAQTTDILGASYELNASPFATANWILDGGLVEPFEITDPLTFNQQVTVGTTLSENLGKKYNAATYFTIGNLCFMVAPYADASGKVAGVKVLDITNGLAAAQVLETLNITTPQEATAAATAVKVDGLNLTITLVADATIYTFNTAIEIAVTIDENAVNTTALEDYDGETVTATVVRNFTNANYMTLTLPFDMSAAQVSQAFGNGNATIYTFASVRENSEGTLDLLFDATNTIQAGYPYILKLKNNVNGFTVDGVTINTTLHNTYQGSISMIPVLDGGGILNGSTEYWLASDNYLYNAGTYNTDLLGLRAYFNIPAGSKVRARAVFNSNETTDIVDLTPENNTPSVKKVLKNGQLIIIRDGVQYNVQGQRME